jgi:hypothetical protein
MTDTQLYLAMAMPTSAALLGILVNLVQISGIRAEVAGLKAEINGLRGEFRGEINSLRAEVKGEINSLRAGLELLTGKVIELVDRVSRLEAKIEK